MSYRSTAGIGTALLLLTNILFAQPGDPPRLPREEWGAPVVNVSHEDDMWVIAGRTKTVVLNEKDLALTVRVGDVKWSMVPSSDDDMLLRSCGEEFHARLSDAGKIDITPFDTGYKTGVKIALTQFRHNGLQNKGIELDLNLFLTVCLEGEDEELVFDTVANENETTVRELDWPKALDARDIDYTILSNARGTLLPRDWPKPYFPMRPSDAELKAKPIIRDVIQSNLIEPWSMSWWGFQKGSAAMMLIVETSADVGYKFDHPAGGPTVIGPRWRASLGKFRYPRTVRMVFFEDGNYVTLAKRYRQHVMDTGQFVSLKEKIAREPKVQELIGTPHTRIHLLKNYKEGAFRYNPNKPEVNYSLATFDQRADELRKLKAKGIDRLYVCLAGWIYAGYDRQHPDVMPPSPLVGGWEGMKRFAETLRELDYLFVPHEQYVDYYLDAPSYNEQFAVHDEDAIRPPLRFPGTRMKEWKTGYISFMDNWDGGAQTYLSPWLMLGHLKKNYRMMFDHGIKPDGAYLDVFGYLPPHDDFNPEHPVTLEESLKCRAACYKWVRNNLGIVGTEGAADWVIPYVDVGSANPGQGRAIPVPLYELVYHDAIVLPYGSNSTQAELLALLCGGVPQCGGGGDMSDANLARVKRIAALHKRVALLEMTNHEFLDNTLRKERTTFADGTTVTVDYDAGTVDIQPEL
jgi:hypothetical protein